MKKPTQGALAALLTASMAAGLGMTPAAAFGDTGGHWGEAAIDRWKDHGIINGYENGNFDPNGQMNRAEVAALLANLLDLRDKASLQKFTDVEADAWYADAIAKCVAAGILEGYEDNTMRPGETISREQVFVMFARAIGLEPERRSDISFTDSDQVSSWAAGYINALADRGVLTGMGNGALAPLQEINRASAVAMLDKAIGTYVNESGAQVEADGDDSRMVLVVAEDVTVTGEMDRLVVSGSATNVVVSDAKVGELAVMARDSEISLEGDSTVDTVEIHQQASGAALNVSKDAQVETVISDADEVEIAGAGKVENALISGDDTTISTSGTKVEVSQGASGTVAGGSPVEGGGSVTTPPSHNGGSGGSGGSGGGSGGSGGSGGGSGGSGGSGGDSGDEEQKQSSVLTTDIGEKTFLVGVPVEFTFSTIANDDAGVLARAYASFDSAEAIEKLEYYEVQDGQWHEFDGAYGPEGGFPLTDITSRFRVTFRSAGTFSFSVSVRSVADDRVLCETSASLSVGEVGENTALVNSAEAFEAAAAAGKDIVLTGSFTAEEPLMVTQAIAIDGSGFTITSTNPETGSNGGGLILMAPASVKNLTVAGPNSTGSGWDGGQYGIKVYNHDGTVLEDVTVTGANAGIQVNSASVALKGTIDVSGNEFGGIEVAKGGGLEKKSALDLSGATLVNRGETLSAPTVWVDGNEEAGSITGGEALYAVAATGTKTHYYLTNFVGQAIASAGQYAYEDGYAYRGSFAAREEGKTVTVDAAYTAQAAAEDEGKAVMHDLARFLGALHRQDEGRTVQSIVFEGNTYTWNQDGVLLGSNWEHDGTTLVSQIVQKALGGESTFQLQIEDITLVLRCTVDGLAG